MTNGIDKLLEKYDALFWDKVKDYEQSGKHESFKESIEFVYGVYISIVRNLSALKMNYDNRKYNKIKEWYDNNIGYNKFNRKKS